MQVLRFYLNNSIAYAESGATSYHTYLQHNNYYINKKLTIYRYAELMNLIELSVCLLAPHLCLVCKKEGPPVCSLCANNCFTPVPPGCYRCGMSSKDFAACSSCSDATPLTHLWVGTRYADRAKEIIALLKFQRVKATAKVIAERLDACLPCLPPDTIVSPVPTASKRIRARGYDQAQLIAQGVARRRRLPYRETLRRVRTTRQVGAGREERFRQLEGTFTVHKPQALDGRQILLIDDVLTTGATLEAAAKTLKQAGAIRIDAAVFAH